MRVTVKDLRLFLVVFCVFLVQFATFSQNITFVSPNKEALQVFSLVVMVINLVLTISTVKYLRIWAIIIILSIFSVLSFYQTRDTIFAQLSLLLISCAGLDFDRIVKYDIYFKVFILFFNLIFYYSGFAVLTYFARDGVERMAFGFSNPNTFGFFMLIAFFEIIYLLEKKGRLYINIYLILLAIFLPLQHLASSRTAELVIIFFSIFYVPNMFVRKQNIRFLNKRLVGLSLFVGLMLLSIYVTSKYPSSIWAIKLDLFLSYRLHIQKFFLSLYDVNLLGNSVDYIRTLDNAYVRTLLNYGIIIFFLYSYIYGANLSKAKGNYTLQLIFISLMLYGLMEWYIIRPFLNIFLVYFMCERIVESKNEINDKTTNFNNSSNL